MPDDDRKRAALRALTDRVRNGKGEASAELRALAFDNNGLPPPLDALMAKVAEDASQVTDTDLAAALASGHTEDQIFELVVCAAVGESTRLYDAGLAALAEATAEENPADAS
ncbi:hypothetical protein [Actinomadura rupiterrae]|uniref:hypothetical protein n=1 Tax=Actinomadura rupiterrae TaxID=559627 RepID=UPI0020A56EB9|nr:hypothetical protein [Actinomadura rupiterrae]MCP2342266.1 alkylhydroperoxidase family enzyme [Actinomadura rupiterrae]